jgi:hypothetical protein
VTEVGESIMVTTPSGITLVWDKGTRVYIKLRTEHKGKVLCSLTWDCHGHDHMVVGLTTTCAISAYHH